MPDTFIEIGFARHCGIQSKVQQDALWNGERCMQVKQAYTGKRFLDGTQAVLLAVADGVAASSMPHLASAFVADAVGGLNPSSGTTARIIRDIHGQLCDRYGRGLTKDTATTVVAACLRESTCQVVNVGDSRAYHISGAGYWTQLSRDHTNLTELREEGYLDETNEESPLYDQLIHCLIANHEEDDFPIYSMLIPFNPGDSLLLCSDGLHEVL